MSIFYATLIKNYYKSRCKISNFNYTKCNKGDLIMVRHLKQEHIEGRDFRNENREINTVDMVGILVKQKEELEAEFTEILTFIVEDMKNQEETMKNLLNSTGSNDFIINEYKSKYNKALTEISELKSRLSIMEKKYSNLANSKLGKITLKYWSFKNRK